MLIFDETNKPVILENIFSPTLSEYFYVLSLDIMDYTLEQLTVLEETSGPAIELMIEGARFPVPANWNLLVADDETRQLDVVEIANLAGKDFYALVYGPDQLLAELALVQVTDYFPTFYSVGPLMNKHQMLCHPISPERWINVAPSDVYNKYLKNKLVGDLI